MNKLKPKYKATTKKNKFRLIGQSGKEWSDELLRMFPEMDLTITVEKRRKTRSNKQNRWYWGVCIPLVRDELIMQCGYDGLSSEDTHFFLKSKFLQGREIVTADSEVITLPASTTTLTTSQAMDFYAQIQRWCVEILGLHIPDPEEQITMTFE